MTRLPRPVRLTGGDYFIHAMDHRMRRAGLPGNLCRMVIRLEGAVDTERLRQRVAASPVLDWLARVRMIRMLPLLPALWRTATRPATIFQDHLFPADVGNEPLALPRPVQDRDLRAERGPALGLDWRRPLMRWIQKMVNFLDARPQWKDIRGYGRHMRK